MTHGNVTAEPGLANDWKDRAACAGFSNIVFFPGPDAAPEAIDRAKAICQTCPVTVACLEYALETNQRAGVWGGTDADQRKSLRRKWLAARRRSA